jgi:hypothetical protein
MNSMKVGLAVTLGLNEPTMPQTLGLPLGCFSLPSQPGRSRLATGTSRKPTCLDSELLTACSTVMRSGRLVSPLQRRDMVTSTGRQRGMAWPSAASVRAMSTQWPSSRSLLMVAYGTLLPNQPARLAMPRQPSVMEASPLTARISSMSTVMVADAPRGAFLQASVLAAGPREDTRSASWHS